MQRNSKVTDTRDQSIPHSSSEPSNSGAVIPSQGKVKTIMMCGGEGGKQDWSSGMLVGMRFREVGGIGLPRGREAHRASKRLYQIEPAWEEGLRRPRASRGSALSSSGALCTHYPGPGADDSSEEDTGAECTRPL